MADDSRRRSRSRSPGRRPPKANRGFRWKESRSNDGDRDRRDNDRRRDYRNRSPPRHRNSYRDNDRERNDRERNDRERDGRSRNDRDSFRPSHDDRPRRRDREIKDDSEKPAKKDKKPPVPVAAPGQEMIVVNINDRLGTKSAIPCLPSDTIRELKIMVAARIGREPGQIMLKRQGERPFKDQLSLEDYGISNGVQLDLEVDTGD
ncbi:unnamed protein product [Clonostachys solani]|uniref:Ubiquitin-like modifier HUB1 n=1 Tax=Clonostachys solani TaxID=160281 RepID=A0A9N9Z4X9_9HYPO|nr:unnamed protein product [Clonostachys solani]